MSPELDKLAFITDTGDEFEFWTSATISDDFLTPCQTVSLEVAADETRFEFTKKIRCGQQYRIEVNGHPVCAGFVDSVEVGYDGHSGTNIQITARDVLSPVVDGNVDPRLNIQKETTLIELAQLVFVDQFQLPFTLFEDPTPARDMSLGRGVKVQKKPTKRKPKDPLKEVRPHDNEGGFQYFTRFAHRLGYHAWAVPDGSGVVIAGPSYEQDVSYEFTSLRGGGSANNVLKAKAKRDDTGIPSHVWVRGKDTKPGPKSAFVGFFDNSPNAAVFKPFYYVDSESSSKEHCDTVAAFVVGKAMRDFLTYEITVRGLSDPATGRVYTVDTLAIVKDDFAGVDGLMWVMSRTFRKSRQGTFTDLKLLPADAMIMDYLLSDSPPPPDKDYKTAATKKPLFKKLRPFEERVAAVWYGAGETFTGDGLYGKGSK